MSGVDPLGGWGGAESSAPPSAAPGPRVEPRRAPRPTPTAWALVIVLGAFFVAQSGLGDWDTQDPLAILRLGGLNWVAVLDGDIFRLGSYSFLHFGVAHYILNAWALFILMRLVESAYGSVSALGIYAIAVLAGGLASAISAMQGHNAYLLAAGASGGIAGLFGAYIGLYVRVRKRISADSSRATLRMLLVNLGLNVLIALGAGAGGISLDNWAHLGGLFAGLFFGLLAPLPVIPRRFWSRPTQVVLVLATFALASMEGAAVARAAHPHARTMHAAGLAADVPWMLVPFETDPSASHAVSPGGIGLEAILSRSNAPLALTPGSEAIPIGDRTWLRVREAGEREGLEIQTLSAKDKAGVIVIRVLCDSEICRGKMADDTAIGMARTLRPDSRQ